MFNGFAPCSWRNVRTGILRAGIVVSAFLVGLLFARHALATTFAVYDDEGYMLLGFQHYFAGGHLYSEVASEYGPFNFFAERFLFQLLHLPVDHDAGRFVALICWLASAALAGFFTYRLSRSATLASAAGLATTLLGRVLANEPGHPQQLIFVLLLLACCASLSRRPMSLLLLGVIGAALFFVKINAGVFYFAAVAIALVCGFPAGRLRKVGAGLLFLYTIAGPLMLMRQDLLRWAGGFCLLAIVCGVSTLAMGLLATPASPAPMRGILYVAAGGASASALIVGESMREGMRTSTLLEGILWGPLRHPRVFSVHIGVPAIAVILALAISASIVALYWFRDRWRAHADVADALRCAAGLCAIALLTAYRAGPYGVTDLPHPRLMVAAFLPLSLLPAAGKSWQASDCFPRLFVTSLAATQLLQAYPVAGSQVNIALAPSLLWAFICVHDGVAGLFHLLRRAVDWFGDSPHVQESVLGGLLALALALAMFYWGVPPRRYSFPPSKLPGSASLHLPADAENRYESLAANIRANCSILFTMPGMGSLNFWSGVPTPNGLNMPSWTRAFTLEQQQRIFDILKMNPQSCAVYNQGIAQFRGPTSQELAESPLAHYIVYAMPKVIEDGGYEIRVSPQRNSPWIEAGAGPSP